MNQGYTFILGAVVAWLGLFGPGILLIFGVLPFWHRFRQWVWYKRALPGFNSAAVGLVVASVFQMSLDVTGISPFPNAALCIGILAFTAVDTFKLFEPAVVLAGAVIGVIAWAAKMS
jgi:chromate transporter